MRSGPYLVLIVGLTAFAAFSSPAAAQEVPPGTNYIGVAPRVGVQLNHESQFVLGAEGRFGIINLGPSVRLDIRPVFDYFFQSNVTIFDICGDAIFAFDVHQELLSPYAFTGLNITHASVDTGVGSASDTRVGLNLGGGVVFLPKTRIQPFAELRFTIQDGSPIVLAGGVIFIVK